MQQNPHVATGRGSCKQDSFCRSPTVSRCAPSARCTAAASASAASGPPQRTPYARGFPGGAAGAPTRNTLSPALQTCVYPFEGERNNLGPALAPQHARADRH